MRRLEGAMPAVYVPPAAQVSPPPERDATLGRGTDYEASLVPVVLPLANYRVNGILPTWAGSDEVSLFMSSRMWTGCDVYLDTIQKDAAVGVFEAQFVWIRVYGITQGIRTLVDSAIISLQAPAKRVWVCSARAQAERFEVTAQFAAEALGPDSWEPAEMSMTVICSDKCVAAEAPPIALYPNGRATELGSTQHSLGFIGVRPVRILATSEAAADRWIVLIDGMANTDPVVAAFAVPQGGQLDVEVPASLSFPNGFYVAVSTTPDVFTNPGAADVFYNLWIK